MRQFLHKWLSSGKRPQRLGPGPRRSLHLELLEDRLAPASFNPLTGAVTVDPPNKLETVRHNISVRRDGLNLIVSESRRSVFENFSTTTVSVYPVILVRSVSVTAGDGLDNIALNNLPSWIGVNVDGRAEGDMLTVFGGGAGGNSWRVTGAGAGDVNGHIQFSGMEYLSGDAGPDRFVFRPGGSVWSVHGRGGADTADMSAWTSPVTVIAQAGYSLRFGEEVPTVAAYMSSASGHAGAYDVETFIGGAGAGDTIEAPLLGSRGGAWHVSEQNAGNLNGVVHFSSFETVHCWRGDHRFTFAPGKRLTGGITRTDDGSPLTRVILDYSAYNNQVSVDLAARTATGLGSFEGIDEVIGGPHSDLLTGSGVWEVTGDNAGTVGSVTFASFENLAAGGSAPSRFVFADGKGVSGVVLGGASAYDVLDYSLYTTPVTVRLGGGLATNVAGQAYFEIAIGGSQDDTLSVTASSVPSVLIGNGGNDELLGGGGRDLLIGGVGADRLDGRGGDDILIDGTTAYDAAAWDEQSAALDWIMSQWTRATGAYTQRIADIRNGPTYKLNSTTVTSDQFVDTLFGDTGRDWFWAVDLQIVSPFLPPPKPRDNLPDWVWNLSSFWWERLN